VSYDVFFQGFVAGGSSGQGGPEMAKVLRAYVAESRGSFRRLRVGDGGADLYLSDDGMIASDLLSRLPGVLRYARKQTAGRKEGERTGLRQR